MDGLGLSQGQACWLLHSLWILLSQTTCSYWGAAVAVLYPWQVLSIWRSCDWSSEAAVTQVHVPGNVVN